MVKDDKYRSSFVLSGISIVIDLPLWLEVTSKSFTFDPSDKIVFQGNFQVHIKCELLLPKASKPLPTYYLWNYAQFLFEKLEKNLKTY